MTDFFGAGNRFDVLAGMHPQAQRITKIVDRFLDKIQGPEDRILAEVREHWQEVAMADESIQKLRPRSFVHGTLTLEAPEATTLYVFQQPRLKGLLLSRVAALTNGEVRQLRIVLKGR